MDYNYTVLNDQGKTVSGIISADTIENAVSELKKNGLYIIEIIEGTALQKNIKFSLFNKIKTKDLAFYCRQMATLLKAGINVLRSFELIKGQTTNRRFAEILEGAYELVEKGNPVCVAMAKYPEAFPQVLVNIVEAGEISGTIDQSFAKMAVYYEKQEKIKSKLKNSLTYPLIVLILAVVVVGLLMIFVLPTFVGLFKSMNVQLPAVTKFILGISQFMAGYWYVLVIGIAVIIWGYGAYKRTPSGAVNIGRLMLKLPVAGRIIINNETSSFTRTLSTLITAGVSLVPALYTLKKLITNQYISNQFDMVIDDVKAGENLSIPIEKVNIFPPLVPVMIRTGEESGNLDTMLEQLSNYYEEEVDNSLTRLIAIIEPAMMVFLSVFIGILMAAIMLPMFQLYGSF